MPAPIIPWIPHNIPSEIQSELNRRKTNRNFNFVGNNTANWDKDGNWNSYKGPMTSWVRMCSNGAGRKNVGKPRFVFHGGRGWHDTYGMKKSNGSHNQIIGYTPGNPEEGDFGEQHIIPNSLVNSINPQNKTRVGNFPINVGTPEISRIEVSVQKELYRRATVEWVCFSFEQLNYMSPYFLSMGGISVILEWGWNHFDPTSLVPLHDVDRLKSLWKNSYPLYTDNTLRSKGNYDVLYGFITNFNWSIEGNKIICSTEITSKDKLYAGLVTQNSLSFKDKEKSKPDEIFPSLNSFLKKDDTIKNIRTIAASRNPMETIKNMQSVNVDIWEAICNPILSSPGTPICDLKNPYVHGVFSGRTTEEYGSLGIPKTHDFDADKKDGDTNGDRLWLNMGLVVELLNHFSTVPGGQGGPMFAVDIVNSVIGAHPNIISCDARVLIPNSKSPKFHYGNIGMSNYVKDAGKKTKSQISEDEYANQIVDKLPSNTLWDEAIRKTFYQSTTKVCFRNDLDRIINIHRRNNVSPESRDVIKDWSFPSKNDFQLIDYNGFDGNYVESQRSGLLSNIYLSFNAFKSVALESVTYVDIYDGILKILMESTCGFWDLKLIESENKLTIVDTKYIPPKNTKPNDSVYTFDFYDSDSIIRNLKFRPQTSDAQSVRTIFGESSNKDSKFSISDKNDLLDTVFRDTIILNESERINGDEKSSLTQKVLDDRANLKSMLNQVQKINIPDDPSLQISIAKGNRCEVFKLILPDSELLKLILDDKDEDNNSRYCAVQPGIVLELSLTGIGGLRTFQYFLVANLPEPYSERNIIFRVTDVTQTLEAGNWETTVRAQFLPLRNYIKNRLSGPVNGTWP